MEIPGYYYIVVYKDRNFGRPIIASTLIRPENVIYELAKGKTFEEVSKKFYSQVGFKQIQECIKYAMDILRILKFKKAKLKISRKLKKQIEYKEYKYLDQIKTYDPIIKGTNIKAIEILKKIYEGKEIHQIALEFGLPGEAITEVVFYAAVIVDEFHLSLSAFEDPASALVQYFNYVSKVTKG
ncbi:MAG: DUF433 domain-containing protein [Saccharolobus sp.]